MGIETKLSNMKFKWFRNTEIYVKHIKTLGE